MRNQFVQPFLIAMVIGSLFYMLGGASQQIERRLEVAGMAIVDDNGRTRITMDNTKDGAEVVIFDVKGEPAGKLAVTKTGVEVTFEGDKEEMIRLQIKDRSAFVDLSGENAKAGIRLTSTPTDTRLLFYDAEKRERMALGLNEAFEPGIVLRDSKNVVRVKIDVEKDVPSFKLFDDKEAVIWSALDLSN